MKKRLSILLIIALAIFIAMPTAVFATAPPPANATRGTLSVEYRFMEGQTPYIPDEITQFGFRFYKVSQSEPVLESTLPAERTYYFQIEGFLTLEQLKSYDLPGEVTAIPVWVDGLQEPIDKEIKIPYDTVKNPAGLLPADLAYLATLDPLETNDVEAIPQSLSFNIPNNDPGRAYPSDPYYAKLDLTGIEFEIDDDEIYDGPGNKPGALTLPSQYTATAVYRGVTELSMVGFNKIFMSIKSDEDSEVDVWVIIAEYESDELPLPIDFTDMIADTPPPLAEGGLSPEDQALVDDQTGNIIQDIGDGNVPLGNTGVTNTWSLISMILAIAALVIAAVYTIGLFAKRKREEIYEELGSEGEKRMLLIEKRAEILRVLTIVVGALTLVTWLYLDDLKLGVTWVNVFTPMIAIMCGVTVVLCVLTSKQRKKAAQYSEDPVEETSVA